MFLKCEPMTESERYQMFMDLPKEKLVELIMNRESIDEKYSTFLKRNHDVCTENKYLCKCLKFNGENIVQITDFINTFAPHSEFPVIEVGDYVIITYYKKVLTISEKDFLLDYIHLSSMQSRYFSENFTIKRK